jgi:iron complex outermembrane receptor protein
MISKTADGDYTPFTPSQKLVPTGRYSFKLDEITPIELFAKMEYNWAQNNTAPFEIKTPSYTLFNAGISTSLFKKNTTYKLSLGVNNIFNKAYYDNLSRFKNYGLLNIGRNIIFNFKIKI